MSYIEVDSVIGSEFVNTNRVTTGLSIDAKDMNNKLKEILFIAFVLCLTLCLTKGSINEKSYGMNAVPNVKSIHSTAITSTTTQSVPNVNPSDKSSIITSNTSSGGTAGASMITSNASNVSNSGSIQTTNTAVTVDAKTGAHPQVHTITTRRTSEETSKPSSRKSSRASANSNAGGIAYC